ncbi:hypothetical protein GP486_001872 [Trichoglossum hirsutum]|uniref:HAD-like protein n=1 Tax=Trichoglossum hirsutum TaxID=265104 RepID=A0A9P8LGA6_9PEZI|nr:hypothetical protein GP486_001872 [Trichoglossum hirsutum]
MFAKFTTIIFDLGDVLFNWSPQTKTTISPMTFKRILSSPTWFEYECGKISQDSCYERIGNQFAIDPSEVANAIAQAQDSLQSNNELVSAIQQLKAESNGGLRIYAMSNVSRPDYQVLHTKFTGWSIFDQVFTSGAVGERKPGLAFYRHVINATGINPQNTIFVDDTSENVLSARSVGFHGIIFDDTRQVIRALRNLVGDPVKRGKEFLEMNSKNLKSTSDSDDAMDDNFMQLLILDATNNR